MQICLISGSDWMFYYGISYNSSPGFQNVPISTPSSLLLFLGEGVCVRVRLWTYVVWLCGQWSFLPLEDRLMNYTYPLSRVFLLPFYKSRKKTTPCFVESSTCQSDVRVATNYNVCNEENMYFTLYYKNNSCNTTIGLELGIWHLYT